MPPSILCSTRCPSPNPIPLTSVLILSRKLNESIVIDGRIIVTVVRVQGDVVKLGIIADADVPVHRQEIYNEIQQSNLEALASGRASAASLPKLARPNSPTQPTEPNPTTQSNKP